MYEVIEYWASLQYDLSFEPGDIVYADEYPPYVIRDLIADGAVVELDAVPAEMAPVEPEIIEDDDLDTDD